MDYDEGCGVTEYLDDSKEVQPRCGPILFDLISIANSVLNLNEG